MLEVNRHTLSRTLTVFIIISLFLISNKISASTIDSIQLLKISAQDERAIIKTSDGQMRIVKPGDVIGDGSKVVEITAGRVVLEEKSGNETETIIIRLEDGKQRVERIKQAPDNQPRLHAVKPPENQKEWREGVKAKREKSKKDKPR